MTFIQLEYIIALDRHRHFAGAAAHCFVTQPTLSMQVHKLEEERVSRYLTGANSLLFLPKRAPRSSNRPKRSYPERNKWRRW
ncbi:MAG: LysR family transcriptional regulator [Bacteroidota bacterium]